MVHQARWKKCQDRNEVQFRNYLLEITGIHFIILKKNHNFFHNIIFTNWKIFSFKQTIIFSSLCNDFVCLSSLCCIGWIIQILACGKTFLLDPFWICLDFSPLLSRDWQLEAMIIFSHKTSSTREMVFTGPHDKEPILLQMDQNEEQRSSKISMMMIESILGHQGQFGAIWGALAPHD